MSYRPDIDGLRALAVMVVVLFHAKLGFSGGYIGVDIFFVISGFLITSLLLRDVSSGKFSLVDFWERRTRRIAPALIVTVTASVITAWFILLPDDLERFGRATMSQIAMAANIYHWREAGYFGPAAETLPLLHTWSLAVEEQFYLFLPPALWVIARWKRNWLAGFILLACVGSFLLSVWGTPRYASASFYLLPTRAWELLLGSLLALSSRWADAAPRSIRETISWLGLATIVAAIVTFDAKTAFPGAAALLPCMGAAGIIWAGQSRHGNNGTTCGRLLALKPIVFLGAISYSLYLVHWPMIVFSEYYATGGIGWQGKIVLVLSMLLLATLSWALIETPFRKKWVFKTRRTLFATTAIALTLLFTVGAAMVTSKGFPKRFNSETLSLLSARTDDAWRLKYEDLSLQNALQGKVATHGTGTNPPAYLIWGDSHARALLPALDEVCQEKNLRGFNVTRSATAPLLNFKSGELNADAPKFGEAIVNFVRDQKVKTVIIAARWNIYLSNPHFAESVKQTVEALTQAGATVVIVRDVAEQESALLRVLARISAHGKDLSDYGESLANHRDKNRGADTAFERVVGPRVIVLDPAPYFVNSKGVWPAQENGEYLYRDGDHLSLTGSRRLKAMLAPYLH